MEDYALMVVYFENLKDLKENSPECPKDLYKLLI